MGAGFLKLPLYLHDVHVYKSLHSIQGLIQAVQDPSGFTKLVLAQPQVGSLTSKTGLSLEQEVQFPLPSVQVLQLLGHFIQFFVIESS